ncbi:helix-turn-helix domain-containing protein [Nesterenkonia flava]|uniref:Helix-turn-helix domain-containing protein n=1 Tax=Nesterenkonia flava TaxID=469799 RepID=A0ABU1FT68_9MICC|nr:helix-turn-helix domain-containing protein [Nesterenkonia flava]MDR5711427.1 helix-turn-helix domain-containing protein [Nesterenkonia flava]
MLQAARESPHAYVMALIRELQDRGVSRKEIAQQAGLSERTITRITTGRTRNIRPSTVLDFEEVAFKNGVNYQ